MLYFGFILCALFIAIDSSAATDSTTWPIRVHTHYVVTKASIVLGGIDEVFTRTDSNYTLTSTTTPVGLLAIFKPGKIFIHSSGMINTQGLKPLLFSYQREGESQSDNYADFDWNNKQLKLNHDGQHDSFALIHGTQDRLSAMYQFMFIDLQKINALSFEMTNGRKLDHYHYSIVAGSSCQLKKEQLATWYLDSGTAPGETRSQLWLIKDQFNLPCKLLITDPDGGQLTQQLTALEISQ